jgi:hypothetical protein
MAKMQPTDDYQGYPIRVLENPLLRLEVLTGGPRLVRLSHRGGPNLFVELPGSLETEYGEFRFLGGHRLWHSPEAMPRTYLPDIGAARLEEIPGGLRITNPPEAGAGIVKQIEVSLDPEKAVITIRHELRSAGLWAVECAPWALTMFRLGGTVILPQPLGNVDTAGLLSNRHLALWPYTRVNDPRLHLDDDFILLKAAPALPPVKLGYFNPHGWIGYWIDGTLFVKRFDPRPGAVFPDGGCNAETYCNDRFVELESLGPFGKLEPGKSFVHVETWELYDGLEQTFIPTGLQKILLD